MRAVGGDFERLDQSDSAPVVGQWWWRRRSRSDARWIWHRTTWLAHPSQAAAPLDPEDQARAERHDDVWLRPLRNDYVARPPHRMWGVRVRAGHPQPCQLA